MTHSGFSGPLPPRAFNMARYCLAGGALDSPDKHALEVITGPGAPAQVWTFADLEDAVLRLAGGLQALGLAPGSRVMIRLANTSEYAILFFATIAAGLVALPTSDQATDHEAAGLLADSGAAMLALDDDAVGISTDPAPRVLRRSEIQDMMRHGPRAGYTDTAADDPAFLIYTSGTTARPKGVLHAHRSAWGRRPMYDAWYGLCRDDRMLHAGAFNWTYTLGTGLTDPWALGATALVYTGERQADIWPALMRAHEATIFAAVPSLYRQILKYAPDGMLDVGDLRHGLTAGETLPRSVAREWSERTGCLLHEALGMSELSTYVSSSPSLAQRPGSVGRAQPGRCVRILALAGGTEPLPAGETGLLGVHRSDPGLMLGYWRRPEEQKEVFRGDWFCGGDLATMDRNGYVSHEGRANDLMNAFGYRVSPLEVEAALAEVRGVVDIGVAEVEVSPGVRVISAFVVSEGECEALRNRLVACADKTLAGYKRPREYVFVSRLPRTANGKLQRARLAELLRGAER